MREKTRWFLVGIIFLTLLCIRINLPKIPIQIDTGPIKFTTEIGGPISFFGFFSDFEIKKGLDIQGGIRVVLEADMAEIPSDRREAAMKSAKEVVERRVDLFGVTEPNIQTSRSGNSWRIIVELPGVTDTGQALSLIGETAQLDFRRPVYQDVEESSANQGEDLGELSEQLVGFEKTELTGGNLKNAEVSFNQQTGEAQVAIEFDEEGAERFEQLTGELIDEPLAIFLDDQPISAPRVQEKISQGKAVISGQFSLDEAQKLAIQLNAGALPVPLEIVEQTEIGATLGQSSVRKSVVAGVVGLCMVGIFMLLYYGKLGILADLALAEYGLISLAIFRIFPITLTMAGIAGFILSIGMAVDSEIITFERIRKELRRGTPKNIALEKGFVSALDA
ncbi:MAG: protein translocase subunit SecD, partial [Patescibacteria group bacterium]|nr:protein translocase subunit SecD [Patescibacteria group bacterium]